MERTEGIDVVECERCPALVDSRTQIVNGAGPEDADIVLVGEGPGANEDEQGLPFVGRSGGILDEALAEAGTPRETVRIVNCVRCRPPENRDPHKAELENCRGYLETEIDAVDPEVVVPLGKVPAEHVLREPVAVTKAAGEVREARIADTPRRVVVSVHPAASLYDSSQRATLDRALERAAELVGQSDGGGGQSQLGDF